MRLGSTIALFVFLSFFSNVVSAAGTFSVWTSKPEYQFGEDIVINWANATIVYGSSVGIFLPGRCRSNPWSCVTTGASTEYFTYTGMSSSTGSWTASRREQAAFRGVAEIICFDSTGPYGSVNVTIVGTVTLDYWEPPVLYMPLAVHFSMSSMYHYSYDEICIFPAGFCDQPSTCSLQCINAGTDTTEVWYNTTYTVGFNINFDEFYQIGYLNALSSTENSLAYTGAFLSGRNRILAQSPVFQFGKFGNVILSTTNYGLSEPINVNWTSGLSHGSDCIRILHSNGTAILSSYIGSGTRAGNLKRGQVSFSGISEAGTYTVVYAVLCNSTLAASSGSITVGAASPPQAQPPQAQAPQQQAPQAQVQPPQGQSQPPQAQATSPTAGPAPTGQAVFPPRPVPTPIAFGSLNTPSLTMLYMSLSACFLILHLLI